MSIIDGLGAGRPRPNEVGGDDRLRNDPARGRPASGTERATGTSGDSVQLTDGASRLQQLQSQAGSEPAFDQAKVDRIKQLISDGEYAMDSQKIAERFVELERAGSL
ncbi:MAG: flagellar biosynthesis anti-sigma factor FlgM [Halothiobacillaceae bacterium]